MKIGIDLGTCYSKIAVYGEVRTAGNYPASQYIPDCNVTLIPDEDGNFAIPSAFWCNPDNSSEKVFGSDAKDLLLEEKQPILFWKRNIGTSEILKIGTLSFTAKEVATEYLKYLKQCAEKALGQPVKRAVITHPAYFSLNQIEETKQAAIDAGFDMSDNEQMLMEPVAATIAFISADPRDEITVLAYDLGGGTFDVTVLEKKYGVITSKAFDGDHLLGGSDFDKKLVGWLLNRIFKRFFDNGNPIGLVLDDNDNYWHHILWQNKEFIEPNAFKKIIGDTRTIFQLFDLAENIKYQLSNKPTSKAPVSINNSNILKNTNGNIIQIIDRINREEYTALIADLLEDTIEKSKKAIYKAGLTEKDIDVILLVGGSSYGQWIKEAVKNAFPVNEVIQHDSPDLVVAMGAAQFVNQVFPQNSAGNIVESFNSNLSGDKISGQKSFSVNPTSDRIDNLLMNLEKKHSIRDIEHGLKSRIIGQDQVVDSILPWIKRIKYGLLRDGSPAGVFLFIGPSGTGKTQLAKELAKYVFGNEEMMIFLEMGQFQSKESVNNFVGALPGYLGYGEGQLTNGLRDKPESVVLLDQIELAHEQVLNYIYLFLNEGLIKDPAGNVIDGRKCIVIMTSDVGQEWLYHYIKENPDAILNRERFSSELKMAAIAELMNKGFKPSFWGRFDEIITFIPLTLESIRKIVGIELNKELTRLKEKLGVDIFIPEDIIEFLTQISFEKSQYAGARSVSRAINNNFTIPAIDEFSNYFEENGRTPVNMEAVLISIQEKQKIIIKNLL